MQITKRKHFDLNHINVARPCSVSWDAMTGDDRSRHCGQCDLSVYDISGLTLEEASELIKGRSGQMCIRLHRRIDGTVITRDCPTGVSSYRRRATRIAGSAIAAILGLFTIGYGQREIGRDSQGVRSETSIDVGMVDGVITDAMGAVIEGAKVTVTLSSGKALTRQTDKYGRFRIASVLLEKGKNRIEIEAEGFNPFIDDFSIRRRELISYPIMLDVGGMIGVIEILREPLIDQRKSSISTTIRVDDN